MNRLSKGIGLVLGVSLLLIVNLLFQERDEREIADHRLQTVPTARQLNTNSATNSLQQELPSGYSQLAQLGNRQSEISALRVRLTELEEAQQRLQAEFATQLDDRAGLEEHAEGINAELQYAQQEEAVIAHFDTAFWQEAKDPAWSHETEQILFQAMDTELLEGSNLLTAGCQTTLCQVEAEHDNDEARDSFMSNFLTQVPYDTQAFYHHIEDGDGLSRTVMYLARAGHELPRLAQEIAQE